MNFDFIFNNRSIRPTTADASSQEAIARQQLQTTSVMESLQELILSAGAAAEVEISALYRRLSPYFPVENLHTIFEQISSYFPFANTKPPLIGVSLLEQEIAKTTPVVKSKKELKELKTLSLLKKELPQEGTKEKPSTAVPRGMLTALFGPMHTDNSSTLPTLLKYMQGFLQRKSIGSALSSDILQSFTLAQHLKETFSDFIEKEATDVDHRNAALSGKATRLQKGITKLQVGKPFIFFGQMSPPSKPGQLSPLLMPYLQEAMPAAALDLLSMDDTQLEARTKAELLAQLQSLGLSQDDDQAAIKKITTAIIKATQKVANKPEDATFYDKVAESIANDLRELVTGVRKPEKSEKSEKDRILNTAEELWEAMLKEQFLDKLHKMTFKVIKETRDSIFRQVEEVSSTVRQKIPKELLVGLSSAGIQINKHSNFWIEIEKQPNDLYTLRLFSNDTTVFHTIVSDGKTEGYQLPLVFSNIGAERLSEDFFFRILSYQAWPAWDEQVSYSLEDLRDGLLASLGKPADNPTLSTVTPLASPPSDRISDWLKLYLRSHITSDVKDFDALYNFELPLELLTHFWPTIHNNPDLLKQQPTLRTELKRMIDQLSKEAVALYRKKEIDYDRLKALYATVTEVEEALQAADGASKRTTTDTTRSLVLTPQMREFIRGHLEKTGVTPTHVAGLKELVIGCFGDDMEETFDAVIKEVLPLIQPPPEKAGKPSWMQVLGVDDLKSYLHEVSNMKPSLLHVTRAYVKASYAIKCVLGLSINARLLSALLSYSFPQIAVYNFLSIPQLAALMTFFGPAVLEKVLPEPLFKSVDAFFEVFRKITGYIQQRIMTQIVRQITHFWLEPEQVASLNKAARIWQQRITREGQISFDLADVHPPKREMVITVGNAEDGKKAAAADQATAAMIFKDPALSPHPDRVPLTVGNLSQTLDRWLQDVQNFKIAGLDKRQLRCYLNEQIRNLPIPGHPGDELWKECDHPLEVIEKLQPLLYALTTPIDSPSSYDEVERATSLHAIYAITDTLARRCKSTHLPADLRPNGRNLINWMSGAGRKITNPRTHQQFKQLATYFGFDPNKYYTNDEIAQYEKNRLFDFYHYTNNESAIDLRRFRAHPEGCYFESLLGDEKVLHRLAFHGMTDATPYIERLFLLFRDPSLAHVQSTAPANLDTAQLATGLRTHADSASDPRLGILPRAYYHLRLAHIISSDASINNTSPALDNPATGLVLTEKARDFRGVREFGSMLMTVPYLSTWKTESNLSPPYQKFFPQAFQRPLCGNVGSEDIDLEINADNISTDAWSSTPSPSFLFKEAQEHSQSALMYNERAIDTDTLPEERALLEMLGAHTPDHLFRALSFFTESMHRLQEPRRRAFFDIFVNNTLALEAQIKERPEIVLEIGRYFKQALAFFKKEEDWGTYLYMAKMGQEVLTQCRYFLPMEEGFPDIRQDFPDFSASVRQIIEFYRNQPLSARQCGGVSNGLYLAQQHLVASYLSLDLHTLADPERTAIMRDIARLAYSGVTPEQKSKHDVALKSNDVIYLWAASIRTRMMTDRVFRNQVLNDLLLDRGINPQLESADWEGDYPNYRKGRLPPLNVAENLMLKPEAGASSTTSTVTTDTDSIEKLIGMPLGNRAKHGKAIIFPENDLWITQDKDYLEIIRTIEGKTYRFLHPTELQADIPRQPGDALWLEIGTDSPTLLHTQGKKLLERFTLEKQSGTNTYRVIKQELMDKDTIHTIIPAKDCEHGLTLLNWFQEAMELHTEQQGSHHILKEITFPKVGLSFAIKSVESTLQAVDTTGITPGFFIAKTQRDPLLTDYAQYLLLQNSQGDKKVHLTTHSLKELFSFYVANHIGHMETSPLLEGTIHPLLASGGDSAISPTFVYSVGKTGKLESNDPAALAYLVFFFMAKGNKQETLYYLKQLQSYGRCYPLSEKAFEILDGLTLPLLLDSSSDAEKLMLEIAALREENILVHQKTDPPPSTTHDVLRAITTQIKYSSYLENLKKGAHPYLSHSDELFLLKSLLRTNEKLFKQQHETILKDTTIGRFFDALGLDTAASLLMIPTIAERHAFLQEQYGSGMNKSRRFVEETIYLSLFGKKQYTDGRFEETTSTVLKLIDAGKALVNHPLYLKDPGSCTAFCSALGEPNLDTLSLKLSSMTPSYLRSSFLSLYRLAMNEIPNGWRGNRAKEKQFKQQVSALHRLLPLLQGKMADPWSNTALSILQTAVNSPFHPGYPSSNQLDQLRKDAAAQDAEYEHLKKLIADERSKLDKNQPIETPLLTELNARLRTLEGQRTASNSPKQNLEAQFTALATACRNTHVGVTAAGQALVTGTEYIIGRVITGLNRLSQAVSLTPKAVEAGGRVVEGFRTEGIGGAKKAVAQLSEDVREHAMEKAATLSVAKTYAKVEEQAKAARKARADLEEKSAVSNTQPLPPSTIEKMQEREQAISKVMQGLRKLYFVATPLPAPAPTERAAPLAAAPTDEPMVRKQFEKLAKSQEEYYAREQAQPISYRLKPGQTVEQLHNDLFALRKEVLMRLATDRQILEDFVEEATIKATSEEGEILRGLGATAIDRLSFEEIDSLFIQDKDEEICARTLMNKEQLAHVKESLYLYHTMLSRWSLLSDNIDELARKPNPRTANKVGIELDRRRVYEFRKDIPERLLRGKLIYESRTGRMLWELQARQMDRVLQSGFERIVAQLLPGAGKSSFCTILESWYCAAGTLNINIWPSVAFGDNVAMMRQLAPSIFSQVANALHIHRAIDWTTDRLWGLQRLFERTFYGHEQINMTKQDLQALQLCGLEQALNTDPIQGTQEAKTKTESFRQILKLIWKKAIGHVDEPHVLYNPNELLNHPTGKRYEIKAQYVQIVSETLFQLISAPEFAGILTVKAEKPLALDPEVFKRDILPLLTQKIVAAESFGIPETQHAALIRYLSDETCPIPDFVQSHPRRSEIALVRGLLTTLMPSALNGVIHETFMASQTGKGKYARPTEGHMNPRESSEFRNPIEALVKSGLLFLHDGLTDDQADELIQFLKNEATQQAHNQHPNSTHAGRFFATHCPGYQIQSLQKADFPAIRALIKKNDRMILTYLSKFVAKEIRYFKENFSSTSSNFASSLHKTDGGTGTPYNPGVFPAGTEVLYDPGTDGETIDLLEQAGKVSLTALQSESPIAVACELVDEYIGEDKSISAIIDRGSIFNGLTDEQITELLFPKLAKVRPDIDGIAFYRGDKLMILEKGAKKAIPIETSTIPVNRRFTIFGQAKSYGANNPQKEDAIGIVTLDEHITISDLSQAIWRMRGLKTLNQRLIFALPARVRAMIPTKGKTLTVRDVLDFAVRNEVKKLAESYFQADKQKLSDVVRNAVLAKFLETENLDQALTILHAFKDLFVTTIEDDPFLVYGYPMGMAPPAEVFKQMRTSLYARIANSPYFSPDEKSAIDKQLKAIGTGTQYPAEVPVSMIGGKIDTSRLDSIGQTVNVDASINVDQNIDQNAEQSLAQQMNLQEAQQQQAASGHEELPQVFWPWSATLNPRDLSWSRPVEAPHPQYNPNVVNRAWGAMTLLHAHGDHPPIFTLKDAMSKGGGQECAAIADRVSESILVSNNLAHLIARNGSPIELFGKHQIPIIEALVIKEEGQEPKIVLITQEETAYWRKKLAEDRAGHYRGIPGSSPTAKIGIYNISRDTFVAEGRNPFTPQELVGSFTRMIAQTKFLRGDVEDYTPQQANLLQPWLSTLLGSFKRYASFIQKNHARKEFEGSVLDRIFTTLENRTPNYRPY